MVQWGDFVLERLVARKRSELTACLAPELPEPYNYFGSFFLNNVIILSAPDETTWPRIVFLRRLANAVQAYRDGREQMRKCVAAPRHSNDMIRTYLNSLFYFESAIMNTYLALMAHNIVGRIIAKHAKRDPEAAVPPAFKSKDGSPPQRLNAAYNALKHFDDNLEKGIITNTVPVWLVDDGIECVGSEGETKLRFDELTGVLCDLEVDARFLAEDVFRMAQDAIRARGSEAR